ncbi:DNAj [Anaeramoeba flamelloides]|uniref:DNAj n=1 Tax=Anaeramoeba flamelloides TaxID=1746091 RepID=A0ABQ8XVS8_9EUKA|nr:DNAj [Anaeramoeba flamelloides]
MHNNKYCNIVKQKQITNKKESKKKRKRNEKEKNKKSKRKEKETINKKTNDLQEGVNLIDHVLDPDTILLDEQISNNQSNCIPNEDILRNEQPTPNFQQFEDQINELCIDFYILYLESKISSSQAERSEKKIKIHYKSIIERSGQIVLVEKIIKTRYFSPITWVNFVVNSSIINYLVEKKKKEIENLVSKNDFNPSSFSSFPSFNKKIKNIPNINADHLILIGFYYDDFKCTDSFSLGGLYMFIDNLEYSWRLKDQTIFLIALFPAKTQINNILKQLPLIQDLDKLKNGLFLGGKKIQAVVSCFVGDTRESFPAKGRLQPGALNSCSPIIKTSTKKIKTQKSQIKAQFSNSSKNKL